MSQIMKPDVWKKKNAGHKKLVCTTRYDTKHTSSKQVTVIIPVKTGNVNWVGCRQETKHTLNNHKTGLASHTTFLNLYCVYYNQLPFVMLYLALCFCLFINLDYEYLFFNSWHKLQSKSQSIIFNISLIVIKFKH